MNANPLAQRGFTLIELLVVAAVLVAVAGIGTFAYEFAQKEGQQEIAQVDLIALQKSIRQFSEDNGVTPFIDSTSGACGARLNSADFGFLFAANACVDWNPGTRTGWKGPYAIAPKRKEASDGSNTFIAIHNGMDGTYSASISLPEGSSISFTDAAVKMAPIVFFSTSDASQSFIASTGWDGVFDVDITSVICDSSFSDDLLCL
jgi:prepilin-type N-terminal cleavage/methylation domain-containing protein